MKRITMSRVRRCVRRRLPLLSAGALRAEVIEQVLVKVNGEIFTKSDLETRQVEALRAHGPAG